jgi:hypothetical protein
MAQLGFGPLLLIKAFPVNMSGACDHVLSYLKQLRGPCTRRDVNTMVAGWHARWIVGG